MTDARPLHDQGVRDTILDTLHDSLLVEAAAGTGKTTSMVGRMTALLRTGTATIDQLAAMTFTVKAAGHLRVKFSAALQAAAEASTGEDRARLLSALEEIDRCFIGTVHSFCATLLRERPVEAGVAPDFTVLEGDEEEALRGRVFHSTLRNSALDTDTPLRRALDLAPAMALRDAYDTLCEQPDVYFPAEPVPEPDLTDAYHRLRDFTMHFLQGPAPTEGTGREEDDLQRALRNTAKQLRDDVPGTADIVRLLTPFRSGKKLVKQRCWKDSDFDAKEEVQPAVDAFADEVVLPSLRAWQEFCYAPLLQASGGIHDLFVKEKSRRGLLGNGDLLLRARDMLRDYPDVRQEMQQRYRCLLVDEFQDTDPVQAEIMLFLTGTDMRERSWRALRPRPGSLFVVGDPRQSIYRFRRADITVYNEVARLLESAGRPRLHLHSSFRSLPSICDWVNARFHEVFPALASDAQAADAPLTAVRSEDGTLSGVYGFPVQYERLNRPAEMLATESAAIARWIDAAIRNETRIAVRNDTGEETVRPIRASDILLLTPTNASINAFAEALEAEGRHATIAGGYALRDRETILPLMHILHALADPLDETSVVAFLRGPFCGADDAALADYRSRGGRFTFFSVVLKEGDQRILDGLAFIKGKVRLLRSVPPAAVVGSVFEELGLLAWTSTMDRGNLRAGTLQRVLEFVQQASARGHALAAIVQQLDAAMSGSQVDGMALLPEEDAVRIMNVHKAKGLEAPVVILARHLLKKQGEERETVCVDRRADHATGMMRVMQRFDGKGSIEIARAPGWEQAMQREQRFLEAEHERLQYVAATRAASVLVVSRRVNDSQTPDTWDVLLPGIDRDVPELHPADVNDAKPASIGTDDAPLAVSLDDIDALRSEAEVKSYAMLSPSRMHPPTTERTQPDSTPPREPSQGETAARHSGGKEFGTAMHRLLEVAATTESFDVQEVLRAIGDDMALSAAQLQDVAALYEDINRQPMWQRIMRAEQRFTELPFGLSLQGEAIPSTLRGIIDLVIKDEKGWTIIDYKTDVISSADDARVDGYRRQIAAYRDAWEHCTGEPAGTVLWFVTTGLLVE